MIDTLLRLLAPHSCCGCGYFGSLLCDNCKYDIVSESFDGCVICLKPTVRNNICNRCQASSVYAGVWCAGVRRGALKGLLDTYKFDSARSASGTLTELLDSRLPVLPPETRIVPVPTSYNHQRVRGFDHTHLIARRLAEKRDLTYSQLLLREDSGTQHLLGRSDRLKSAQRGLSVKGSIPETVLLVDDIYTTGATLDACALLLRANGAKTVFAAVIARQVLDEDADLW